MRTARARLLRLVALPVVLATAALGLGGCAPAISVGTVLGGLDRPWDLGFTPDGTLLFTERSGDISAVVGGGERVLHRPADVVPVGEGGMLGLAVDPAFASNRRIYTCFLSSRPGGVGDVRVVRWTVDAGYTALGGRADIVTGLPVDAGAERGRHSGCRPRFGPDGQLWVGTGDAATGTVPQSPTSLGGKVLRVDTAGRGSPGNPGGGLDPRIYTRGHRNVQGLAFRPGSGTPYSVEHGTGRDDEVNRLVRGGNGGWDPAPGYDESRPMTDTARYPGAMRATWSSGASTIAPSGATFLTGSRWGSWDGALVLAVLKGRQLRVLHLDDAGALESEETALTDQGRLRSVVQGPDGDLYATTDAGEGAGRILRVSPG